MASGARTLRNRYYLVRHGQSEANVAGIIVSAPRNGVGRFGLSPVGRDQVRTTPLPSELGTQTIVYTSDFLRASETAAIIAERLGAGAPVVNPALRERDFGRWELTSIENYARVWADDERGSTHEDGGVERADHVAERVRELVAQIEANHDGADIVLVSHGDTLQILQAVFSGIDPALHRSLPHLETAEVRPVP